jgi:predicted amidophosphoribosyltransferase
MLKIIHSIVDQIFPPRPSELIVRSLDKNSLLHLFRPHPFRQFTALTSYQHPAIKALIQENKFHRSAVAAKHLGTFLQRHTLPNNTLFLPIPLGKKRLCERGYNQVTQILKQAGVTYDETIITRSKETPPQTSLDKVARLTNLTGAFTTNDKRLSHHHDVTFIIVDDVTTTGATLEAG